jgi:hypothetical protein
MSKVQRVSRSFSRDCLLKLSSGADSRRTPISSQGPYSYLEVTISGLLDTQLSSFCKRGTSEFGNRPFMASEFVHI